MLTCMHKNKLSYLLCTIWTGRKEWEKNIFMRKIVFEIENICSIWLPLVALPPHRSQSNLHYIIHLYVCYSFHSIRSFKRSASEREKASQCICVSWAQNSHSYHFWFSSQIVTKWKKCGKHFSFQCKKT